ncbi:MAG: DM13 domain-containing protein [Candidatus Thiodiazotropha sp. LLP2]
MKLRTVILLIATHCIVGFVGFGAGIYALPILTAPPAPSESEIKAMFSQAKYTAEFRRDLKDSDTLHWGEGTVSVSPESISLMGKLAPGPDYKLYLSSKFVETESEFNRLKDSMVRVGDVKTFENFIVHVPPGIDPADFNSVIIWCESFGQFITSAKYR